VASRTCVKRDEYRPGNHKDFLDEQKQAALLQTVQGAGMNLNDLSNTLNCNICACEFEIDNEGGIEGYIGILYFAFCPMCFTGVQDMCDSLRVEHYMDESEEDDDD